MRSHKHDYRQSCEFFFRKIQKTVSTIGNSPRNVLISQVKFFMSVAVVTQHKAPTILQVWKCWRFFRFSIFSQGPSKTALVSRAAQSRTIRDVDSCWVRWTTREDTFERIWVPSKRDSGDSGDDRAGSADRRVHTVGTLIRHRKLRGVLVLKRQPLAGQTWTS